MTVLTFYSRLFLLYIDPSFFSQNDIIYFYGKQEIPKDNKSYAHESFGPCSNPFTYLNWSER